MSLLPCLVTVFWLILQALAIQKSDVGVVDWHSALLGTPLGGFLPLDDSLAVTVTRSGVLGALNISDGSLRWRYFLPSNDPVHAYRLNQATNEIGVLSGCRLLLFSARSGVLLRETLLKSPCSSQADLILSADGSAYVANGANVFRVSSSGKVDWEWAAPSGSGEYQMKLLHPSSSDTTLYSVGVTAQHGFTITSLNIQTGEKLYSSPIPTSQFHVSPSMISPLLVFPDDTAIAWLDRDTKQIKYLWLHPQDLTVKTVKPLSFKLSSTYNSLELFGDVVVGTTFEGILDAFTLDPTTLKTEPQSLPSASTKVAGLVLPESVALVAITASNELVFPDGSKLPLPLAPFSQILSMTLVSEGKELVIVSSDGSISLITHNGRKWERQEDYAASPAPIVLHLPEPPSSIAADLHEGEAFVHRVLRHASQVVEAFLPVPASESEAEANRGLYKDPFSFRQVIVRTTSGGWVVGIDGKDGRIAWRSYLEGASKVHKMLVLDEQSWEVVLVADGLQEGQAMVYKINSLTGAILDTAFYPLRNVLHSYLLPLPSGKAVMLVDTELGVQFYPAPLSTDEIDTENMTLPLINQAGDGVTGYRLSKGIQGCSLVPQWVSSVAAGEAVVEMKGITPNAGDASAAPAASFGKVIPQKGGGRNVLYKYLNPRLATLVTSPSTQPHSSEGRDSMASCRLSLLDGVKGTIIYSINFPPSTPCSKEPGKGIQVELVENSLVYVYYVDENDDAGKGWRAGSVEFFEGDEDVRLSSSDSSSFNMAPLANLTIFEKTFLLPHWVGGVLAIKASTTKRGVAGRDLILSTTAGHILNIPYKMLNPRRPPHGQKPTTEQMEQGLIPYEAVLLGVDGKTGGTKRVLSHSYHVGRITALSTHATLLESTSLVLAYGELDMFMGRVSPSGTFDRLSEGFNKPQLILTIIGLSVGILIVRPIVKRKQLKGKWYS